MLLQGTDNTKSEDEQYKLFINDDASNVYVTSTTGNVVALWS